MKTVTPEVVVDNNEAIEAAEKLGAAIHARSSERMQELYDDGVVVWHGSTRRAQTKSENIDLLSALFELASYLEYKNVRRHPIEGGGVVQQHTLVGRFGDGAAMPELEACLVIYTKNGRITRLDEYFDGGQYAEVFAKMGKG